MSKKDFEMIACVLRAFDRELDPEHQSVRELASRFADELASTNPRFDRARFIAACMGEDSTDSAGRKVRYS